MPRPISFDAEGLSDEPVFEYELVRAPEREFLGMTVKNQLILTEGRRPWLVVKGSALAGKVKFEPVQGVPEIRNAPYEVVFLNQKVRDVNGYQVLIPLIAELYKQDSDKPLCAASLFSVSGITELLDRYIDVESVPYSIQSKDAGQSISDRKSKIIFSSHAPWRDKDAHRTVVMQYKQQAESTVSDDVSALILLVACTLSEVGV